MTPFIGFTPDAEPTTPGVITDCDWMIPYEAGMRSAPALVSPGIPALASECRGSGIIRVLSGTSRLLSGTTSDLYEASGTAWNNVGTGYTLGSDDRWQFVAFGDAVLAVNSTTTLQRSTGAGFSAVTGAPKAKCIVSTRGFAIVFATNEATYGDSPDRWWCSEYLNETGWTPSLSTQCVTGRLVEGSGGITAAVRFGSDLVVYKQRAMFIGTYVGAPEVWRFTGVSYDVGCVGQEAAADTNIGHIFVGTDSIYHFDGTRAVPIATGQVRQWWLDNSSSQYRYRTKLLWDRDNSLVWIFFPSSGSTGTCDDCIVFHTGTRQWGRVQQSVEAAVNYVSSSITYDTATTAWTYDTGPAIAYDSPFWLSSKTSPAVFDSSHILSTFTGVPISWYLETGDFGDETNWSYCSDFRMRFALKPASMTCTPKSRATSGDSLMTGSAVGHDGSKFPLRQTARFHRFRVDGSGSAKVTGAAPTFKNAGTR